MHFGWKMLTSALTVFLLMAAAGCGDAVEETGSEADVSISITDSPPVAGWLDVLLPGAPLALDASGEDVWILVDGGIAMNWNSGSGDWEAFTGQFTDAVDIAAMDQGTAVLTPGAVSVIDGEVITVTELGEDLTPVEICSTGEDVAVLLHDGSVVRLEDTGFTVVAASSGLEAEGCFSSGDNALAWLNSDGTASYMGDLSTGLVEGIALPEGAGRLDLTGSVLTATDGEIIWQYVDGSWETAADGVFACDGIFYTAQGIFSLESGELIASGQADVPDEMKLLADGTIWTVSEAGTSVWCELGSVETRLPEADVQRLSCTVAGQVSGGSDSGEGVSGSGASFGGVFRIYESVSSRPDPFTEIPATSRDLRRSLEDISIEELHLVGITIDPAGGDQAMVEDANGVAYILQEGTVLKNNTRIAEITGNEVIVVQEVMVGSEDEQGGATSIPTIFSMRLHEEGGL